MKLEREFDQSTRNETKHKQQKKKTSKSVRKPSERKNGRK